MLLQLLCNREERTPGQEDRRNSERFPSQLQDYTAANTAGFRDGIIPSEDASYRGKYGPNIPLDSSEVVL